MPVGHAFTSAITDEPPAGRVRPTEWNAGHVVNVDLATEVTGILPASHIEDAFLKLDQTTPQTVINGIPHFSSGIEVTGVDGGDSTSPGILLNCGSTLTGVNFGIKFTGVYSDGISFDGLLGGSNGVFNYFSCHDNSFFLPQATGKAAWSVGTQVSIIGSTNADGLYGFRSSPGAGRLLNPYTGTLGQLTCYEANTTVLSGATVTEHNLFKGNILATDGIIVNQYGINLPNINAGTTLNYAIKSGLGQIYFGDKLTTKGNILPDATATYDIGTSALHWRSAYLNKLGNLTSNGFVKTGSGDGTLSISSTVNLTSEVTGDLPYANLAQGSALSVLGVTGNATADNASIAAASDNQVLRRSGTAVAFGAVNLASTSAVTGRLAFSNIAQNSMFGVFANTTGTAEDLGNIVGFDQVPNYIFDSLEAGSAPDASNTQIMLRDNNVGYTQAFPLSDVAGVLQTYLAGTTFGQPAQRINVATKTANYTLTEFDGLVECNAAGGAFNITTAALSAGRQITIIKTDSSVNAITVQTNIFGGNIVLTAQGQNTTIRKGNSTTWYTV